MKTLFKGHLLYKMHFFTYIYVSPVSKETHKVSENKTLSRFLLTHISKNGTCCGLQVITEMWAGYTLSSWQRNAHVPTYRPSYTVG